ncbi:enhanced intracellular survival protein Eis [Bacillus sp. V59.32b]|uniref:GNAT family N-acetyltransferase n=1 Tax=Bacillus sp. V59.32b TaxID=1758642 RepID=UPI000E3D270B|nr:GNAT family N-acetyltransferase [Bacillus sp. V59.32b]RFU64619.1 GNAT family N-acetyltransferase [Bacillus sp. V59.32b]
MNVITLQKDHYREALALSEYAFQYKVPEEDIEKRLRNLEKHKLFGILENGSVAAKLHLLSLETLLGKKAMKMGGIAGVATYPEQRRKGHVREMLAHSLQYMKDNGYSISMLHPFSVPFYRKYGWELFANRLKVTLTKADLVMKEPVPGVVKRFDEQSHPEAIERVYTEFTQPFNGMLAREKDWWTNAIYGGSKGAMYLNEQSDAAGYMIYEIKDRKMTIHEFVVVDNEARSGLWNYICQHDSMLNELEMITYENDPLMFSLKEPRSKMEVVPYFMVRIVDVISFFREFDFQWESFEEELVLHISDSFAEWNNQSVLLKDGNITVLNIEDNPDSEQKGIHIDINALAAAMFGYMSPVALQQIGRISGSPVEIQKLASLLPNRRPFFYDFF